MREIEVTTKQGYLRGVMPKTKLIGTGLSK